MYCMGSWTLWGPKQPCTCGCSPNSSSSSYAFGTAGMVVWEFFCSMAVWVYRICLKAVAVRMTYVFSGKWHGCRCYGWQCSKPCFIWLPPTIFSEFSRNVVSCSCHHFGVKYGPRRRSKVIASGLHACSVWLRIAYAIV